MPQVDIGQRLYGYSASGNPTSVPLGFEYGGNQYMFLHAGGSGPSLDGRLTANSDGILHSFKSTDAGATWVEVGGGPFIGNNYSPGHTICVDGDTAYLLYIMGSSFVGDVFDWTHFRVAKFDLLTETWGGSTNYATPVLGYIEGFIGQFRLQLDLVRRGPGDMIFYYQGAVRDGGHTQLYYSTFDGTTFGGGVELPDMAGKTQSFRPIGLSADSAKVTHFFYTYDGTHSAGGLGNAIHHVAMDAGGGFGTTEVLPFPGVYESSHVGTASAPIVFIDTELSSPLEIVALTALSVEDLAGDGINSHRLYWAKTVGDTTALIWSSGIITQGVFSSDDHNIASSDETQVYNRNITLSFLNNLLLCAWTAEPFNGGPGWTSGDSWTYYTTAKFGDLVWSTPAIMTTCTETFFPPVQISSWAMPIAKAIGVLICYIGLGNLTSDEELTQFNAVPALPPPKKTKGTPFIEPFIHGQFRKPHRLGTSPSRPNQF